jgi:tetratricopeptide (TPR) repeat protein
MSNYLTGFEALGVNRPGETVETYARYRGPSARQRVISVWRLGILTEALHMLGRHEEEVAATHASRELYADQLALRTYEIRGLAALGRVEQVTQVIEDSLELQPGQWTAGYVMLVAAKELRAHGHPRDAREVAQRAVGWCRSRPEQERSTRDQRTDLAEALYSLGRWDEAQELYVALAEEDPDDLDARGRLGSLAFRMGDIEEAERIYRELLGLDRPFLFGAHLMNAACIAAVRGEREQAVDLIREALAQGFSWDIWVHREPDFESLRDFAPFQELLRPKG